MGGYVSLLRGLAQGVSGRPELVDDDLIAAAVQDRCYGGGPGLAVSWLHGDVCANEIRRQRGGIAEVDGAPGAGFQVVGDAILGAGHPGPAGESRRLGGALCQG